MFEETGILQRWSRRSQPGSWICRPGGMWRAFRRLRCPFYNGLPGVALHTLGLLKEAGIRLEVVLNIEVV